MVGEARRWLCTVLAVAVLGCPSAEAPGSGNRTPGQRTAITFWHAMGGPLGNALKTMVDEFEKQNPAIDITLVSMGEYSSLSQKLMAAVQVDAPPNMAQMYESWTTQFHELDRLIPLDSFVRSPAGLTASDLGDFYPAFIADNSWDSRLVTMPFNKSVPVFFYNIEMLKRAGYHEFPRKWPEFRTMVKDLTDKDEGVVGTVGGVNEWQFGCMLRQLGGDFIDEESGKALFNSEPGIRAAQFQYDLVAVDSSAVFGAGYDTENDFLTGRIACIWGTSVSWAYMKDKMTFPVGIAAIPTWDSPDVISFGTNVGVFRTGTPAQAAACWKFIKWFTSTERQAEWAVRTSYVPARRSSQQEQQYAKMIDEIPGLDDQLAQLEYMSFEPRSEEWFNGRKILAQALEKTMRGQMSAKDALDEAAALVEKELKE